MKVQVSQTEQHEKELLVSLSVEDMKPYLKGVANKMSKNVAIKGFRKGNVPYDVLEKHIGKDQMWNEASMDAIEDSYKKAIQQNNIQPAGQPKADITKLVAGNDVEFKVRVPLSPITSLPDYKDIAKKVLQQEEQKVIEVTEHEIHDAIEYLQQSRKDEKTGKVPELNNEFAKSVGSFQTMDDLTNSVKSGLTQEKEQHNKEVARLKIIEAIRKDATIEFSELLIENELASMEQEFQQRVSTLGVDMGEYLKKMGKTAEQLRDDWKGKAKGRVESTAILNKIAEQEDIQPSDEEVQEHANKYLSHFTKPEQAEDAVDPSVLKNYIYDILKNEKVLEFLESQKSPIITP